MSSIPAVAIPAVLELVKSLDKAFGLSGECVAYACQRHPELRIEVLDDVGEEIDEARAAAVKRINDRQAEALARGLAAGDVDDSGKGQP